VLTTYEAPEFVWVVRRWCSVHTDPILWCFDNPEGLNYRVLA
jgi:hypothetical protein